MKQFINVKYGALALLVLQNTFLVVFMRYSRTITTGPMYLSSTAVAVMEALKFICCIGVIIFQNQGLTGMVNAIYNEVITQPTEILKLSVPSLLYTIQNNLLYFALSNLDAATFQVGYQAKILTTAVFSVIMLGKSISKTQWLSLILLTIGVSLAQLSAQKSDENSNLKENSTYGFVAVILAACTSGFSGVYFERILKSTNNTSLWIRNVQMGFPSIIIALLAVFLNTHDRNQVYQMGFFYGYNYITMIVIFLQAIGGLVVAVVVKYADNILKGFAASFSLVTSCFISYYYLDFQPTYLFFIGAIFVNVSVYLYGLPSGKKPKKLHIVNSGSSNLNTGNATTNNNAMLRV